jgi:hypothetical protein
MRHPVFRRRARRSGLDGVGYILLQDRRAELQT